MAGRQIRLKRAELRLLRISELRRLMEALGISGEGPGDPGDPGAGTGHGAMGPQTTMGFMVFLGDFGGFWMGLKWGNVAQKIGWANTVVWEV